MYFIPLSHLQSIHRQAINVGVFTLSLCFFKIGLFLCSHLSVLKLGTPSSKIVH